MNRNQLISHLSLSGVGIEVGVQQGWYSQVLLDNSKMHMYLLDSWKYYKEYNDPANVSDEMHLLRMCTAISILRKHEGRFTIIRDTSINGSKIFQDNFFDFVYIDANHSYTDTFNDLQAWFPKVKPGGIFAGHDYLDKYPVFGVKSAVDNFLKNYEIKTTSEDNFKSWYIIK
jgi:hypothetical protein